MGDNLQEKIKNFFPIKWENKFIEDLKAKLQEYESLVAKDDTLDSYTNNEVLNFIKDINEEIIESLSTYNNGLHHQSYGKFKNVIDKYGFFNTRDQNGIITIEKDQYYYRARQRIFGIEFSYKDMLHIPLTQRGIVSAQRYSCPGYPSLYLGNTTYSCWEEMRRPHFDDLMFSIFKTNNQFKVIDLRIPSSEDYESKCTETLKKLPLIMACSVAVKNYSDIFKPEYIISQMLIESIIENNNKNKNSIKEFPIGVLYTSTHLCNDFPYGEKYLENLAIPVIQDSPKNDLDTLFTNSDPICYEYGSLLYSTNNNQWDGFNDEQHDSDEMQKKYDNTKMGLIETWLKKQKE